MKIYVLKNQLFLGILQKKDDSYTFTYADGVEKNSYIQNLQKRVNSSKELFTVFENLMPENEQLNLLKSKYSIKNEIEILLYLADIQGSYEFYLQKDFEKLHLLKQKIFDYEEKKEEILASDYKFPNIIDYSLDIDDKILYPHGLASSKVVGLSGYQYKFSITLDVKNSSIKYNQSQNSKYFMKPYSKYHSTFVPYEKDRSYIPYLLINEHIFMTLARDFGFDVPYNGILKHGDDYHYIIKRFDRYKKSKIDHYEILALMGKNSTQKYSVSMENIFTTVREYLSQKDILKLYRFVVFSVVIGHGDLHAKNLSLIYKSNKIDEKEMTLSPFYDIATTKIYKKMQKNDIGLKICNKTKQIKKEELLKLATFASIDIESAKKIIEKMCIKFIDTFKEYILSLPDDIKTFPYYTNIYRTSKPFEVILKDYYKKRVEVINKNILQNPYNEQDNIW